MLNKTIKKFKKFRIFKDLLENTTLFEGFSNQVNLCHDNLDSYLQAINNLKMNKTTTIANLKKNVRKLIM